MVEDPDIVASLISVPATMMESSTRARAGDGRRARGASRESDATSTRSRRLKGLRGLLKMVATMLGATSCAACLHISVCLLMWGRMELAEPNMTVLVIETAMAAVGVVLNGYVVLRCLKDDP